MSSSSKKKLRKEQNAAALTEKQQQELKEAKNLKRYTVSFAVVMVLVVAIVIGVVVRPFFNGIIIRNTPAVTIGDYTLNSDQLSYYYIDAIDDFYNTYYESYGSYASLYINYYTGLDISRPLDAQTRKVDNVTSTWADYFVDEAINNAKRVYAIYALAMADEDFKLTESQQNTLDTTWDLVEISAMYNGISSAEKYLQVTYGDGASKESYLDYYKTNAIASYYMQSVSENMEYEDKVYRDHEKGKFNNYSSFNYSFYYLSVNEYLEYLKLGTPDEKDEKKMVYSDEDRAKAMDALKKDMETLLSSNYPSAEHFKIAVQSLDINKDVEEKDLGLTAVENSSIASISNKDLKDWLGHVDRKPQDVTSIANTSITDEDKDSNHTAVVNGYYVAYFSERNDNNMLLENVRHILVKFEGGKYDSSVGATVYTDAEKAKAKDAATAILNQWNNTATKDEAAFIELAKKESDDSSASEGGLIEDIYPGMTVDAFNDWCFDEARKKGDVEMIETEYGYHIMYYIGESDITFRDAMIRSELVNKDMEKWLEEHSEKISATKLNVSRLDLDHIINATV